MRMPLDLCLFPKRLFSITILLSLLMLGVARTSQGTLGTHVVSGEVIGVDSGLGSQFLVGDQVTYTFEIDNAEPDSNLQANLGVYNNAVKSLSITIGSYNLEALAAGSSEKITLANDFTSAVFDNVSISTGVFNGPSVGTLEPIVTSFSLSDLSAGAFGSDSLSEIPPADLSAFTSIGAFVLFRDATSVLDDARVSWVPLNWTATAVPEPVPAAIVASLVGYVLAMKRRRASPEGIVAA